MDTFSSPDSTSIKGASYDVTHMLLTVTFKRGPINVATYTYENFPLVAEKGGNWDGFKDAASKGDYFQRNIRNQFTGKPVVKK